MTPRHEVIVIEADEQPEQLDWTERQIRVAAYCRVSTEDEEQQTSYNTQMDYFRDKIMTNPHWIMAGVFADEGISATSTKKRTEFQKMLRKCKQGKIDLILTKSVSRFARNTLDCIGITRELKNLGVAVYFEKENINTMESDSEFVLTILGSLAQAESESISKNVAWGKRQAMKSGKVNFQYSRIYGYERGEDNRPKIIEEQAQVIRRIFNWYLSGTSVTDIQIRLNEDSVPTPTGKNNWTDAAIRSILKNEKFCGDVIQQKTFVADVITKRVVKNNGQLPKYLIKDYHEPIVSREIFYMAQAEMTKRANKPKIRETANRDFKKYSGMYGLNNIMICAECGSAYKRMVWTKRSGEKQPVWRCFNRIENGTRYCKKSPTIKEAELQPLILEAIRTNVKSEDWQTQDYLPIKLVRREWSQEETQEILELKRKLIELLSNDDFETAVSTLETDIIRLQDFVSCERTLETANVEEAQPLVWNEMLVRNLISKVIVNENDNLLVKFKNGKSVSVRIS